MRMVLMLMQTSVALDAHADDWLADFGWRELVVRVRNALRTMILWMIHGVYVDGGSRSRCNGL